MRGKFLTSGWLVRNGKYFLGEVGVDGLDVFVVFDFVEEVLDFVHLFFGEFDGGGGDAFEGGFLDGDVEGLDALGEEGEVGVVGDGANDVVFGGEFFEAVVDEGEFDFLEVVSGVEGEFDDGFAGEHEVELPGLDELSAVFVKDDFEVADGAVGVVGGAFDVEEGAVWAFAFVGDFGDIGGVFAGSAFDGGVDFIFGEVLRFGGGDDDAEACVGFGVWSAVFGGHGDGFGELGKHAGHFVPAGFFCTASTFECASHKSW